MADSPVYKNPKAWMERYDTHIANQWASKNSFLFAQQSQDELPGFQEAHPLLPVPYWIGHPAVIDCYWRAWELAFSNLKQPTIKNDFVSNYSDTAFNGNLFMWDSAFITCFGLYGRRAFNFQGTLDNFYRKQHSDGFICREISESDGQDTFQRFDPSSTGPNVLAWAEWNHFVKTGESDRLEKVFAPLLAYHQWTRKYRSWPDGSYWTTGWGCGMDNLPRVRGRDHENWGNGHLAWVDATFQALLSAKILLQMAEQLENKAVDELDGEVEKLHHFANENLWDDESRFYFDRFPEGKLSSVKHIGAYWALLAGAVPRERLSGFIDHLDNPLEFKRPHRIPALSADDPDYSGTGGYWCGGIWPPTNYMVLKGLDESGYSELAFQIARNHLENVVDIYLREDIHWEGAAQFKEFFHFEDFQFDDRHTLWEDYAADVILPNGHAKPGYVGWSGLPPVAVFLEDVLGIFPDVPSSRLTWNVRLLEEHGVHNYPFGKTGTLDLTCRSRKSAEDHPVVEVRSNIPLQVEVTWNGNVEIMKIDKHQE